MIDTADTIHQQLAAKTAVAEARPDYVHGSTQLELNRLRDQETILRGQLAQRDERIRVLEGALRDLAAPALRAERLLEVT